jgi:glucokinase
MNNVIAMDIGGSTFRLGLFDAQGRRLLVSEGLTDRRGGREWMLEEITRRFQALKESSDSPIRSCGVSFGGPVDFAAQKVTSLATPGWQSFALTAWARETLAVPCLLDNDANAGALGEFHYGAGRGTQSMFYVTLSTGIGGGLIAAGEILRGKDSLAGEIGHLPMTDAGVICSCGARGCLETLASGSAIARTAQQWAERRPDAVTRTLEISGGPGENLTAKAVAQAAAEGDLAAGRIMRDAGRWLGRALLTVIRIVNPDKIVLGGGVAQAGKLLLDPIHEVIEELKSPMIPSTTEIVLAELGTYSPLYGAAAMALEAV